MPIQKKVIDRAVAMFGVKTLISSLKKSSWQKGISISLDEGLAINEMMETETEEQLIREFTRLLRNDSELFQVVMDTALREYLEEHCVEACRFLDLKRSPPFTPSEQEVIEALNILEYLLDHKRTNSSKLGKRDWEIAEKGAAHLRKGLHIIQVVDDLTHDRERQDAIDRFGLRALSPIELRDRLKRAQEIFNQLEANYQKSRTSFVELAKDNAERQDMIAPVKMIFVTSAALYDALEKFLSLPLGTLRAHLTRNEPQELYIHKRLVSEIELRLLAPRVKRPKWEEAVKQAAAEAQSEVAIAQQFERLAQEFPEQADIINRKRRKVLDAMRDPL